MVDYRVYTFKDMKKAEGYAKSFKKDYGFFPTIFEERKEGKFLGYSIVKPKGLSKL